MNGHLRITIFFGTGVLKLGDNLLAVVMLLLGRFAVVVITSILTLASLFVLGLLLLNALLLGFDLRKKRIETAGLLSSRRCRSRLGRRTGFSLSGSLMATLAHANSFFNCLFLGNILGKGFGTGTCSSSLALTTDALFLVSDLSFEALKGAVGSGNCLLRLSFGVHGILGFLALCSLGLAAGALFLDSLATNALLLFGLLLGLKLFGFDGVDGYAFLNVAFNGSRAHFLTDFLHVSITKHAGVAFSRDFHIAKAIKHVLAGQTVLLRKLMYAHSRHINSYRIEASIAADRTALAIRSASSSVTLVFKARCSLRLASALVRQSTEQTYAPRPGILPVGSNSTEPSARRTMRISVSLSLLAPQEMQVRSRFVTVAWVIVETAYSSMSAWIPQKRLPGRA